MAEWRERGRAPACSDMQQVRRIATLAAAADVPPIISRAVPRNQFELMLVP